MYMGDDLYPKDPLLGYLMHGKNAHTIDKGCLSISDIKHALVRLL